MESKGDRQGGGGGLLLSAPASKSPLAHRQESPTYPPRISTDLLSLTLNSKQQLQKTHWRNEKRISTSPEESARPAIQEEMRSV